MKNSEVTIVLFTDYSKAFDTIDFPTLIKKMSAPNFYERFLYCSFSYLSDRWPSAQIDSIISNLLITNFGVYYLVYVVYVICCRFNQHFIRKPVHPIR